MREIKFRGKRIDNKEWVVGQLLFFNSTVGNNNMVRIAGGCEWNNETQWYHLCNIHIIEENTIGQYTGLKDKNGVEIYEGDILEYMAIADGKQRDKVIFDRGTFVVDYSEDYKQPVNEINHCAEVIGNIYDNPELIEKEGKVNE